MASEKLSSAPLILLALFCGGVQQFTEENTMFQLQISLRGKRFRGVGKQRNSKKQDFARKRLLRRLPPNAPWHIDSNHKLIWWRLITHVCVDEYSRIIIYAHCCNNNKADTVLGQFVGGVNSYGLPSRVRSDFGMENFKVVELR